MTSAPRGPGSGQTALVIGAGIGGLAAAVRLAQAGFAVTVLERQATPGGKMRCLPSDAGPVDAGPTVLTMRPIIDELFADVGEALDDHLTLHRQHLIARHFWPDGSCLDLYDRLALNLASIRRFAGNRAAQQFLAFSDRARVLFSSFNGPMMQTAAPSRLALALNCLRSPNLIARMAPFSSLATLLENSFDDPRLAQLFGRYATYVGGAPDQVPALLALIWQAELSGVWKIHGGMHHLARTLETLCIARGGQFVYNSHVSEITQTAGRATGVLLADGSRIKAGVVVFNGDPRALATGALGGQVTSIASQTRSVARSLSAQVWAFAARAEGPDLAHHNVFFRNSGQSEFDDLARGALVSDPTLYICAMDRGDTTPPPNVERFEIIANAPPLPAPDQEFAQCHTRTFQTLRRHGLSFDPEPGPEALTTPTGFDQLFPDSQGSLYGQSPHGLMAAFQRPTARTAVQGLYLAGGGAHPGAGVPMAILSARHAVEAILADPTLTSMSRRMATPGGMSTDSAPAEPAPSASSRS
ncbi:1-hydroxycarotenoid 3,4-desaturase [Sagittula marina]|uniref:1-hydroxycarotenoid 3,4-desaturase n=1 Tax=Sagittula marina TaxID=943940 RepID=A0A7W6DXN3_9RHOB|nr:1-hydroxycarotenoid 3,4-desaturase CrtD [Sagittula marina]MBB3988063.1 1-hydroxycarotenoid 3,4-desaturase [Sagittula marina]